MRDSFNGLQISYQVTKFHVEHKLGVGDMLKDLNTVDKLVWFAIWGILVGVSWMAECYSLVGGAL